jgi:hypothetical protein
MLVTSVTCRSMILWTIKSEYSHASKYSRLSILRIFPRNSIVTGQGIKGYATPLLLTKAPRLLRDTIFPVKTQSYQHGLYHSCTHHSQRQDRLPIIFLSLTKLKWTTGALPHEHCHAFICRRLARASSQRSLSPPALRGTITRTSILGRRRRLGCRDDGYQDFFGIQGHPEDSYTPEVSDARAFQRHISRCS